MKLRTIVYVDGLNLQRRFFDKSGHYYVDIPAIIRKSLPDFYDITTVKYYTSLLQKPDDNHKQSRLLQAHTNKYKGYFQITYGTFAHRGNTWKFADKPLITGKVMTDRLVEKATDVNLACDMVWDSFDNSLECLALVTNDSDFRMVLEKSRLNKKKDYRSLL